MTASGIRSASAVGRELPLRGWRGEVLGETRLQSGRERCAEKRVLRAQWLM